MAARTSMNASSGELLTATVATDISTQTAVIRGRRRRNAGAGGENKGGNRKNQKGNGAAGHGRVLRRSVARSDANWGRELLASIIGSRLGAKTRILCHETAVS